MHRDVIGGRRPKPCICEVARCAGEGVDDLPKHWSMA